MTLVGFARLGLKRPRIYWAKGGLLAGAAAYRRSIRLVYENDFRFSSAAKPTTSDDAGAEAVPSY